MRKTLFILIGLTTYSTIYALSISEIMSNPVGDDGGREWVELFNPSEETIDLGSVSISIKGGNAVPISFVSGQTTMLPHSYAIVASTVSGATKFSQDYPGYTGPLYKASMSLVNTGITSLDIRVASVVADAVTSYTAAKEGATYARVNGTFVQGDPTPGEENRASTGGNSEATSTGPVGTQTLPQQSSLSSDIVLYLESKKQVVVGAPSTFSIATTDHTGKALSNVEYSWSFGDGGQKTGSTTEHVYLYPGRYIVEVEAGNGSVRGVGRVTVDALNPEISLSRVLYGKYGPFVDITNPNLYELDISSWQLTIDGAGFRFPKHTILASGVTHVSGASLGFASTTIASSSIIKIVFPNGEELARVYQDEEVKGELNTTSVSLSQNKQAVSKAFLVQSGAYKQTAQLSRNSGVTVKKPSVQESGKISQMNKTMPQISQSITKKDTRIKDKITSWFK